MACVNKMDPILQETVTHSFEETNAFAKEFGKSLGENDIICFFGDLGAGKTSFIKGLSEGAANIEKERVQSPTFTLLNIYEGNKLVYHFDLYRLKTGEEFFSLGFDEYLLAGGICCIEWSEKIQDCIPEGAYLVTLSSLSEFTRKITVQRKI